MCAAIDSINLATPLEHASWKRFLDAQREGLNKGDPGLYDFIRLPACSNDPVTRAFQTFSESPSKETFDAMLKDLRSVGDSVSEGSLPAQRSANRPGPSSLPVPTEFDSILTFGRQARRNVEETLSANAGGSHQRRHLRIQNSNTVYTQSSPDGPADGPADGQGFVTAIDAEEGNEGHDGIDAGRIALDDEDEYFSLDEDPAVRVRNAKGKRKDVSPSRKDGTPSKKVKASAPEERVLAQALEHSRTVASGPSTSLVRKTKRSAANVDADADVIMTRDNDGEDDWGDGTGTLETIAARQAAKGRWAPLKSGRKEWRHEYINSVSSLTVLYYFDLVSRTKKKGEWQLQWTCRCCGKPRTSPAKGFSNLSSHILAKAPKPFCHMRTTPVHPDVRPWIPEEENLVIPPKPESAVMASSRHSMENWRGLDSENSSQKQTVIQRRAVLISANPHLDALKSPRTLVRDVKLLYQALIGQAIAALRDSPGRFTIQHDTWTTPSRRDPFLAVHATWVDIEWQVRTACIGFAQLGVDHTGAACAGRIADLLDAYGLWPQWSGVVVSDGTETNIRAGHFLQQEIASDDRSLPQIIRDRLLPFSIRKNVVLCFAHGLDRAIVDGTAAAGGHTFMASKDPKKIIRPAKFLDSKEVAGSVQYTDHALPSLPSELGNGNVTIGPGTTTNEGGVGTEITELDEVAIAREYGSLQIGVDELMEELGIGDKLDDTDDSKKAEHDAAVEDILRDYEVDTEPGSETALNRLWKCLNQICSSTTNYLMFKQLIADLCPGETQRNLPQFRNAIR